MIVNVENDFAQALGKYSSLCVICILKWNCAIFLLICGLCVRFVMCFGRLWMYIKKMLVNMQVWLGRTSWHSMLNENILTYTFYYTDNNRINSNFFPTVFIRHNYFINANKSRMFTSIISLHSVVRV